MSASGAVGLMQLIPSTAKWVANELNEEYSYESLFNSEINVRYGCFYLNYLFDKFSDMDCVICAYNAGETKVLDWIKDGKIQEDKIDYTETKNYLRKVKGYYRFYKNKELYM